MGARKKSHAANSLYWYSLYLFIAGLLLLIYPKPFVMLLGLQNVDPAWRVVGMFVIIIGLIIQQVVRLDQMVPMYKLTIYTRTGALIIFICFVLAGLFNIVAIILGTIDFGAAMWTMWGIKRDERTTEP